VAGKDLELELQRLEAQLPKCALLEGHQLDNVALTTEFKPIAHKLGRRIRGYVVVGTQATQVATSELLVSAAAMQPYVPGNWVGPNQASWEYWELQAGAGLGRNMAIPLLGLQTGMYIKRVIVTFYRAAAANPAFSLVAALNANPASATAPAVAWTNPTATGVWQHLEATYNIDVGRGNYILYVTPGNNLDRIRACYIEVTSPALVTVMDDSAGKADLATNIHLRASTPSTVSLWVY
jgi:hypothetical protein